MHWCRHMLIALLQETRPSEGGKADQRAAQAETDMAEAGDVGEWLGTDSSRRIVANGTSTLSRHSSSGHMDEVRSSSCCHTLGTALNVLNTCSLSSNGCCVSCAQDNSDHVIPTQYMAM